MYIVIYNNIVKLCKICVEIFIVIFFHILLTILLNYNHQIWAFFINLLFLGQALTIMLVYIWSRRNPYVRMNFFGVLNFQVIFSLITPIEV